MSNPSYSILIPVFNAQDSLPLLLNELLNLDDHDKPDAIIVVDDGSTDGTVKKICKYNINLHKTGKNMGKGYALRTGFDSFLKDLTSEYILCMDADLQHSPNSIKDFKSIAKESGNLVEIGLREISIGKMPFARFLSNKITSYILSVLCKQKLKDSQCGYRLIHRSVIKDMPLYENGFQLESEFLIRCSEKNIKIEFIPIPTVYNKHGSNIKHFYDSLKFLKLVIKEVRKKWFIPNKEKK